MVEGELVSPTQANSGLEWGTTRGTRGTHVSKARHGAPAVVLGTKSCGRGRKPRLASRTWGTRDGGKGKAHVSEARYGAPGFVVRVDPMSQSEIWVADLVGLRETSYG